MSGNSNVRSPAPVAIVTGGASGMGLGVVERLVELGWNVSIVDFDDKTADTVVKRLGKTTIFIKANVIKYEQQADAFAETFNKWNRLDLVFANAGITDRVDIYEPAKEFLASGAPMQPDALVIDVCLYGCVWSSYLAMHYFKKNPNRAGKLVMTSSVCGIYATDALPLYTAAKHGVVGLTRALSCGLAAEGEPVTVNCLCPSLTPTPLAGRLVDFLPEKYLTPVSTIVRAVEEFVNDSNLTGKIAECQGDEIYHRSMMEYSNPGVEPGLKALKRLRGSDAVSLITKELMEKVKLQEGM